MAYVLGFFAADGNMIKNRRGAHFLSLEITDLDILLKIKKTLGSSHKISSRPETEHWKTRYRFQIGSKEMYEDLLCLGITPNKSKIIQFPSKIPAQYLSDYIRGYFDGDGCVHLGRYWRKDRARWKWQFATRFTSGSKDFLGGLWRVLRPYVRGGFIVKKKGGYELVFAAKDSLALSNFIYNNGTASLFLERKFRKFQQARKTLQTAGVV